MRDESNTTKTALRNCLALTIVLFALANHNSQSQSIYRSHSFLYLYGDTGIIHNEKAHRLVATPDSGFILLAADQDSTLIIMRVNPLGVPVWTRTFIVTGTTPLPSGVSASFSPADSLLVVAVGTWSDGILLIVMERRTGKFLNALKLAPADPSVTLQFSQIVYDPTDNTFTVAGTADSNGTAYIFATRFSLQEILSGGGVRWTKLWRPTPNTTYIKAADMEVKDGKLFISGDFVDTTGGTFIFPAFLLAVDSSGNTAGFSYYTLQTQRSWSFNNTHIAVLSNTHLALVSELYLNWEPSLAFITVNYSASLTSVRLVRRYYHTALLSIMLATADALPGGAAGVFAGLNDSTLIVMALDTVAGNHYNRLCLSYPPYRLIPADISLLRGERFAVAADAMNFASTTDPYGIMLGGLPASLNAPACGVDTSGCSIVRDTALQDSLYAGNISPITGSVAVVVTSATNYLRLPGRYYDIVEPLCGIAPIWGYAIDTQTNTVVPSRGVSVQPRTLGNFSRAVEDTFMVWGVTDPVNYIIALPWGRIDSQLVATYYPSAVHWRGAQRVAAPDTVAIILKRKPQPPAGLCKIRGIIREGSWLRAPGDPLADIIIILSEDTGASIVVATTTSGTDGTFEFAGVAPGTYWVIPDVTGIPVEVSNSVVRLAREGDSAQVTFIVDSNIIRASVTGTQPTALPAPESPGKSYLPVTVTTDAYGALFIYLHESLAGARIRILNAAGATLAQWQTLPSDRLYRFKPPAHGMYIVEVETPQGSKFTLKTTIQR